jgi:hypothetical protein
VVSLWTDRKRVRVTEVGSPADDMHRLVEEHVPEKRNVVTEHPPASDLVGVQCVTCIDVSLLESPPLSHNPYLEP